jgi:ubiquinone biosynthesis protein Coq4
MIRYMYERLEENEEGRSILANRPRISSQTLEALAGLPESTVGGTYYAFMKRYPVLNQQYFGAGSSRSRIILVLKRHL